MFLIIIKKIYHIFTENVGWCIVKVKTHSGIKDHSMCMHSRKPLIHVCQKKHYHIVHLVSAISGFQVTPVTSHAVFFLNLLLLALSLQS